MTFNSGASESGFSFSGWSALGGAIYVSNLANPARVTKNSGTWNFTSFTVGPFTGANNMRVTSNLGDSYNYNTASAGTHTLNWTGITSVTFTRISGSGASADHDNFVYSVASSCVNPSVPTVTYSPATVCNGNSATLNISGSLNSATQWSIYTGSCGGTLIGNTSSSTFLVTPGAPSTTYFIRGEDGAGCVDESSISCGSVTVTTTTDITAPIADAASLSDITAQCTVTSLTAPTATDNCAGSITGTHNATLPITAQGTTTVTWTYDDGNGNTSTQDQNVVIDDRTAPIADAVSLSDITAECTVTSLTAPTATDNCAGSITGTHNATLPITAQGTTTVTWTYDDGNGNTSTQDQRVVIDDKTAPVADAVSLSDITAQCTVTSLTAPTATDNCAGSITGTHNATLPITAQGTTTVTWTYDDGNGNTSTQDQKVVIDDKTAPIVDAVSLSDITAECTVTSLTAPTATDNCAGSITGTHNATLPITAQGTTTVTWTYDDGHGNTSTQDQNIVIDDTTAPVADAVSLSDVTAQCTVTSLTAPTATDNCAGSLTGTHNATLPITAQGTTTVTWTYDDGHGNTSTQDQNIVIDDTTAPVADAVSLSDVTAQCTVTSLTAPTATDNCAGSLTGTHNATLPITAQGTTTVTWTYDDGHGNTTTQDQNIVIDDKTAPIADAVSLSDVTAQCTVTSLTAPTATDNCAGSITGTHNATLPITAQGTTTVMWTYDDGHGNTSTQDQNIVIDDTTAPVADAESLSDVTAQCTITSLTAPTATDNCAGSITGTHNATLPITTQGTTTVTWTYDDGHGNTSTQDQNIVIDDTTAPVADAVSLSDITAQCTVTSLTAPTATDNCAGSITGTHNATLPITAQGTTTVTWTYDDGNGNTSTQDQKVVIDDKTAPIVDAVSLSDITAQCTVTSLTAPTATDNCAGSITGTHNATLPITAQGTTTVTWTYDDGHGNTSTQDQNIVIDDTTAPVADALSLSDVTAQCTITSLTAPTATDNCAGSITGTHNATLPITAQGTTTVTWTYDDGHGNTTTQDQNIVIDDKTAPMADAVSLSDVTAQCTVTSLTAPTATDNCAGSITGTHNATLPITAQGTTTVTWTYDDGHGNTTTQDQNIVIDDTTAPIADALSLSDVTAQCTITSLTAPTATDNCAGGITGTHNATLPITAQGTTTVTWTYDDGHGNTSTQDQNIIITELDNTVSQDGFTLTANATGHSYQWIDCNNGNSAIPGETNRSFSSEVSGSYAVEISGESCSTTSECITMALVLGIDDTFGPDVNLFPNPTKDNVFITFPKNLTDIRISIVDAAGKEQYKAKYTLGKRIELPTKDLVAGVYYIHVISEGQEKALLLIKE
ncbi:T9SS type A sorting domain-containing protein [Fulvivirgaceae bacterium BMA12]|uniref:T9SS type A sorting domain-containing protein n=1 Tax=Agaribacillus aureus TaxID=3051825 RepID=A0ABT8LD53_9BACT|nr:T9SS type A sorting domain-containing protein [Fulvivirgaceae bacterium BMA12]